MNILFTDSSWDQYTEWPKECIYVGLKTGCRTGDSQRYSVPVIGTPNKIQGRNTLEKGLRDAVLFVFRSAGAEAA